MARQRGYTQVGRVRSRRMTDWGVGPGGTGVTTLSASGSSILGAGVTTVAGIVTLVRTRGLFDVFLTAGVSAGDGMTGAVGIGIVSEPAFDAGIASIPTPITEAVWEGWLWHSFFSVHVGAAGGLDNPGASQRIEIDSKAMRKFSVEDTFVAVVELVETGAATAQIRLDTRMLFKQS